MATTKKAAAKKRAASIKKLDLSKPLEIPMFGNQKIGLMLDDVEEDDPDVLAAVKNLLAAKPAVLGAAAPYVAQYRHDHLDAISEGEIPPLEKPSDVWKEVRLGFEMSVTKLDSGAEKGVYFSLECNCDWEPEHGLQLVVRDGKAISKVGPYDGHVTNAKAYADKKLIGVIYKGSD
jgi:hypothetical protein